MSFHRNRGFTIIELMTTLVVIAVLAAIALPSFQGVIRSNRVATTSNEILASLALARSEATKGVGKAGVCPSSDGATCATGTDWGIGWMVWREDHDSTGVITTPVRFSQASPKMTITGPSGGLEFTVQGRLDGSAQTFQVGPKDAQDPIRCVSVNVTGQHRITKGACQ